MAAIVEVVVVARVDNLRLGPPRTSLPADYRYDAATPPLQRVQEASDHLEILMIDELAHYTARRAQALQWKDQN